MNFDCINRRVDRSWDVLNGIAFRWCNSCGGKRFRLFKELAVPFPAEIHGDRKLSHPGVGRQLFLEYRQCQRCGLVGINPLTRFSDIYRTFTRELNLVAWADCDFDWYSADKLRTTRHIYDQYDFERYRHINHILDVGCGPGVSLHFFKEEKGWEARGIDPDLHAVRIGTERYGARIRHGFVEDLDEPPQSADVVVLDNSIEHTLNPLATLLAVYRVLRAGGGVFIATPNAHGLATTYLGANAHWGHWFLFTPRTLVEMLERVGFRITRLFAVQETLEQGVLESGVQIEDVRPALSVAAVGPSAPVIARLVPIVSDYFHVFAEKPEGSGCDSPNKDDLERIAAVSMVERSPLRVLAARWARRRAERFRRALEHVRQRATGVPG